MRFDPERHHRRSIRMAGYDYSQAGAYFVTICVASNACLLGEIVDGEVILSEAGEIVLATWASLPARFPGLELDAFVVMPNHVHGIIVLMDRKSQAAPQASHVGAGLRQRALPRRSLTAESLAAPLVLPRPKRIDCPT